MPVEKEISVKHSNIDTGGPVSKRHVKLIIPLCLLFLGITIWLIWINKNPVPDQIVFDALKSISSPGITKFMLIITFLGNHEFLIPANLLLLLFFLFNKNGIAGFQVLFVALSSLCIMSLLKNLAERHRPPDPLVAGITNYSYPSGHAFMSVAFYGLLIWHLLQSGKKSPAEKFGIIFLLVVILLIGLSRIYLRVHYTTDVVAGFSLGTLWLIFCLWWSSSKQSSPAYHGFGV